MCEQEREGWCLRRKISAELATGFREIVGASLLSHLLPQRLLLCWQACFVCTLVGG